MKKPKNYKEALDQIRKLKEEQMLSFVAGVAIGALGLLLYITYNGNRL